MYKSILLLVFLKAICILSFSQLKFGIKTGLNLATIIKIPYSAGYNRTAYFNAGLITRLDLSKRFYFSPQLLYSEKGYSEIMIPTGTSKLHLNYISMPLYFGYKLTKGILIQAGPEISYLLSGKFKDSRYTDDVTDIYNRVEFGISYGLNIKLTKHLFSELMINNGITNLLPSFGTTFPASGRNNVLQINFGYTFEHL